MTLKPSFAQHNCCDCKLICKIAQKLCSSFYYDYGDCIHCSSTGVDSPNYSLFPSREYQLHWMRTYLEESAALRGMDRSLVSETDVESLYQEVQHFVPVRR